jgi:uncharacterized lipoprotein YddW (UPF0748 family)
VARGDATYVTSLLPSAHPQSSFDALAYLVPRARELGLEVHAWVSAFLVWSSYELPTDNRHLLRRHPNWLTYSPNLDLETQWDVRLHAERFRQGVFLKPSNPNTAGFVRSIVKEILLRYDVDGVLLDYLRYPSQEIDMDEDIRTAFHRSFYVDPPILPPRDMFFEDPEAILWGTQYPDNDASFGEFSLPTLDPPPDITETPADFLPEIRDPQPPFPLGHSGTAEERERVQSLYRKWVLWKAAQVTGVVAAIRAEMHRNYPNVYLSATVIPDIAHARNDLGQDWTLWVRDGLVDFVVPYFFAVNTNLVRDQMNNVSAAVGIIPVIAGVAIFNQPANLAADKIRIADGMGYSGVSLFSYDSLVHQIGYWQELGPTLKTNR